RQRIAVGERVAHDVRGSVGDPALERSGGNGPGDGLPHDVRFERPVSARQAEAGRHYLTPTAAGETSSAGTSTQPRRADEASASSASCTPLAPSRKSCANGSSAATRRRNLSHP